MDTRGFEREARAGKQELRRRGDQDFVSGRGTRDASGFVDRKAANIGADQFHLTGVNSSADGDAEVADRRTDCLRASNRPGGSVEEGQEAVAGSVDLASAKPVELATRPLVVLGEQFAPGGIAQPTEMRSRVNYIGAKYSGEDPITVGRHRENLGGGELDCFERFVADNGRIVPRWNIVNVVDSEVEYFAGVSLDAQAALENYTQVMDLAGMGVSDRPHVARPSPSRLEREPPNGGFVMGDGIDPPVREAPNLVRAAKTLYFGTRHTPEA